MYNLGLIIPQSNPSSLGTLGPLCDLCLTISLNVLEVTSTRHVWILGSPRLVISAFKLSAYFSALLTLLSTTGN